MALVTSPRLEALRDAATIAARANIQTSEAYEVARAIWRQWWSERDVLVAELAGPAPAISPPAVEVFSPSEPHRPRITYHGRGCMDASCIGCLPGVPKTWEDWRAELREEADGDGKK